MRVAVSARIPAQEDAPSGPKATFTRRTRDPRDPRKIGRLHPRGGRILSPVCLSNDAGCCDSQQSFAFCLRRFMGSGVGRSLCCPLPSRCLCPLEPPLFPAHEYIPHALCTSSNQVEACRLLPLPFVRCVQTRWKPTHSVGASAVCILGIAFGSGPRPGPTQS